MAWLAISSWIEATWSLFISIRCQTERGYQWAISYRFNAFSRFALIRIIIHGSNHQCYPQYLFLEHLNSFRVTACCQVAGVPFLLHMRLKCHQTKILRQQDFRHFLRRDRVNMQANRQLFIRLYLVVLRALVFSHITGRRVFHHNMDQLHQDSQRHQWVCHPKCQICLPKVHQNHVRDIQVQQGLHQQQKQSKIFNVSIFSLKASRKFKF